MEKIKHQFGTLLISVYNGVIITAVCLWFTIEVVALLLWYAVKNVWQQYLNECERIEAKIKKAINY